MQASALTVNLRGTDIRLDGRTVSKAGSAYFSANLFEMVTKHLDCCSMIL